MGSLGDRRLLSDRLRRERRARLFRSQIGYRACFRASLRARQRLQPRLAGGCRRRCAGLAGRGHVLARARTNRLDHRDLARCFGSAACRSVGDGNGGAAGRAAAAAGTDTRCDRAGRICRADHLVASGPMGAAHHRQARLRHVSIRPACGRAMSATAEALAPAPPRAQVSLSAACAHCGLPIPAGTIGGFCCGGCAAANAFVRELGLERYYQTRTFDPAERAPRPPQDTTDDATLLATAVDAETSSLSLLIDGLHCAACVWLIEQVLSRDPAVISARVNLTSRRLAIRWTGGPEIAPRLVEAVRRIGYRAIPFRPEQQASAANEEKRLLRALAV